MKINILKTSQDIASQAGRKSVWQKSTLVLSSVVVCCILVIPQSAHASKVNGYVCRNWGTNFTGSGPTTITGTEEFYKTQQEYPFSPPAKVYGCKLTSPKDLTKSCPTDQKVVGVYISTPYSYSVVIGDPSNYVGDATRSSCR